MKRFILIFIIILFVASAKSQIIAGDSVSSNIYFNNFPDIQVSSLDSLDLDQDGYNDIRLTFFASGIMTITQSCGIAILNNNLQVVMRLFSNSWLDTMQAGTIIDDSKYWVSTSPTMNFSGYERDFYPPNTTNCYYYGYYWGTTDHYMGFRIIHQNDTLYGWLQVAKGGGYSVKSYAIQTPQVGIKDNDLASRFQYYPNPCKSQLQLTLPGNTGAEISIHNQLGNPIKSYFFKNDRLLIELESIPPGVYFIRIKDNTGALARKIVIQH